MNQSGSSGRVWRLLAALMVALAVHGAAASLRVDASSPPVQVHSGRFSLEVRPTIASTLTVQKVAVEQARPAPRLREADGLLQRMPPERRSEHTEQPVERDELTQPESQASKPSLASSREVGAEQPQPSEQPVNQPPRYPTDALMWGIEGEVRLALTISESGQVLSVIVDQSSGFLSLDEAARTAAERWRFDRDPGGKRALTQWIRFRLDDDAKVVVAE